MIAWGSEKRTAKIARSGRAPMTRQMPGEPLPASDFLALCWYLDWRTGIGKVSTVGINK